MNLKEAKIMLEKINRLYESMMIDSKIDPFEQELMLSYIKKLYTAFSLDGKVLNIISQHRLSTPAPKAPEPREVKQVIIEKPRVVAPTPKPAPTPEIVEEPIEEIVVESIHERIRPKPSPKPKPKPASSVHKTTPVDQEISSLFEDQSGNDLSDRLASLPVKDLSKSMGLNEKILTVNELFGKDQQAFTTALHTLNAMGNFEDAKKYLEEYAQKYSWTSGGKKKKAEVFIKLVRRRYK